MHDYLRMDMDYLKKEVLEVSMMNYVDKVLNDFPEELGKSATILAADFLSQVRDKKEVRPIPENW